MFLISGFIDNIKAIGTCASALVAVCTGYVYLDGPIPISNHYFENRLAQITLVQNTQTKSIDRFLLYQQQEALVKAKNDPAASTSPTVQERIRELEDIVKDTQNRVKTVR